MNAIKPIETLWKGYRFRSRLEARWAVFFETLGVRWEYESQGFELSDGTRYLPDFYLPDRGLYVEIKPAINYKHQKVYMAGKIEDHDIDWRMTINRHYPGSTFLPGYHTYVGPYPTNREGHASFNIPSTHGMNSYGKYGESEEYDAIADFDREFVVRRCLEGIDQCDVLFAWINTLDCYGTIAEIGYARAKGKSIFIGISKELKIPTSSFLEPSRKHDGCIEESHDLWFIETMADDCNYFDSPREAFYFFMVRLPEPFEKIHQLDEGFLIAGNPYPGEYTVYCKDSVSYGDLSFKDGMFYVSCYPMTDQVKSAFLAARSARFEHGESPK